MPSKFFIELIMPNDYHKSSILIDNETDDPEVMKDNRNTVMVSFYLFRVLDIEIRSP